MRELRESIKVNEKNREQEELVTDWDGKTVGDKKGGRNRSITAYMCLWQSEKRGEKHCSFPVCLYYFSRFVSICWVWTPSWGQKWHNMARSLIKTQDKILTFQCSVHAVQLNHAVRKYFLKVIPYISRLNMYNHIFFSFWKKGGGVMTTIKKEKILTCVLFNYSLLHCISAPSPGESIHSIHYIRGFLLVFMFSHFEFVCHCLFQDVCSAADTRQQPPYAGGTSRLWLLQTVFTAHLEPQGSQIYPLLFWYS